MALPEKNRPLKIEETELADILVNELNLSTWELVTTAMEDRPGEVSPLEWFLQGHENLRSRNAEILCKLAKIEYLKNLAGYALHPLMSDNTDILTRAQELDAVLLIDEKNRVVLAFAAFDNLKRYRALGRSDLLKDPIRVLVGDRLVTACADRDAITRIAAGGGGGGFVAISKDADNFWQEASANNPAQRRLTAIFNDAMSNNATDLDFDPGRDGKMTVKYRRHGNLFSTGLPFTMEEGLEITRFLGQKSRANTVGGMLHRPAEGALVYQSKLGGDVNLRVSLLPLDRGGSNDELISISIRLLPRSSKKISLSTLKFSKKFIEAVEPFLYMESGMLVVTGPTNSGKSTTIAAFINEHVELYGKSKKRISLEDPVERYLPGVKQISVPGNDAALFEKFFESILRHDPDLIWVGEIRSKAVAEVAIWAALTGHQVYTTLHASDTTIGYKALANKVSKDKRFELAESLQGFIGQRLAPELCPHCSHKDEVPTEAEKRAFRLKMLLEGIHEDPPEKVSHANVDGCKDCRFTGFLGLVPLVEVLPFSRQVRDLFLEKDNPSVEAIKSNRSISFYESGIELVNAGRIALPSIFI